MEVLVSIFSCLHIITIYYEDQCTAGPNHPSKGSLRGGIFWLFSIT